MFKKKYHAFISYSREDKGEVDPIVNAINRAETKSDIFIDQDVEPGDEWEKVILGTIRKTDIVFVYWTEDAEKSSWVKKEIDYASRNGKVIIPIRTDNTPFTSVLKKYQALDFVDLSHDVDLDSLWPGIDFSQSPTEVFVSFVGTVGAWIIVTGGIASIGMAVTFVGYHVAREYFIDKKYEVFYKAGLIIKNIEKRI